MAAAAYRVRFVRSKKRLDAIGPILKEVEKEFDSRIMPKAEQLLGRFTSTWDNPPGFKVTKTRISATLTRFIEPTEPSLDKWIWASQGTGSFREGGSEYPIEAVNFPNLVYPQFYDRKTKPGGRFGGSGEEYGDIIRTFAVMHPGIEPREFEFHAALWLDQWGWRRHVENAIRRGLRTAARQQKAQTVEV